MTEYFDDKNLLSEIEKVCQAYEKASDSKYLTEWADARDSFINRIQQEVAKSILK